MRVEIHKISEYGFYKKGADAGFETTLWMLNSLKNWINSRNRVEDASTFEEKNSVNKAYCQVCFNDINGYGIALWNSVPSTEKGVAFINMNDMPGKVKAGEQNRL
jgi:hypothetical protein